MSEKEQKRLGKIQNKNLATAKAYQMRLSLQDIYRLSDGTTAGYRLRVWCRWVRWVARYYRATTGNVFASMRKMAQTV